jgi:hypothetical protein
MPELVRFAWRVVAMGGQHMKLPVFGLDPNRILSADSRITDFSVAERLSR